MRIWVITRLDSGHVCPVLDTARLTNQAADAYVEDREAMATAQDDEQQTLWFVNEIDMSLDPQSPRIMAEAATP